MSHTRMTPHGLAALMAHEGIVPAPYRDSVGVWTYGVGLTAASGVVEPETMPRGMPDDVDAELERVIALFRRALVRYEREVADAIRVDVTGPEFDALVSFHYNTGGIKRAKLMDHLNAGRREDAARAFMGWCKPPSIKDRRKSEQTLFREGAYPAKPVTVWRADEGGQVIWSAAKQLSPQEAAELAGRAGGSSQAERDPTIPEALSGLKRALSNFVIGPRGEA